MAEINTDSGGKKKHSKKVKRKKLSTRVDLTPMVDLGFLLITFFMLATTLIKPQTMEISMPSKEKVPEEEQTKVKSSKAMTIVLAGSDSIYYYFGTRENDIDPQLMTTDYSSEGIRQVLINKNAPILVKVNELRQKKDNHQITEDEYKKQLSDLKADTDAPVAVIKATEKATYKNMVDILDEMNICHIGKYAIVDITGFDRELINNRK
jgi:biopolymer transport protein ExbD